MCCVACSTECRREQLSESAAVSRRRSFRPIAVCCGPNQNTKGVLSTYSNLDCMRRFWRRAPLWVSTNERKRQMGAGCTSWLSRGHRPCTEAAKGHGAATLLGSPAGTAQATAVTHTYLDA